MSIVLSRIDDRLIHGQVMTAWVSYVGGKEILIVDDKVAKDPFLSAVITGAAPKHLKATAVTVEQATKELLENKDNEGKKYISALYVSDLSTSLSPIFYNRLTTGLEDMSVLTTMNIQPEPTGKVIKKLNKKISAMIVQVTCPCIILNSVSSVPHDDPGMVLKLFLD